MREFSKLLDTLYFISATSSKTAHLIEYLKNTPDPERGWAIAALAGTLKLDVFKRALIKKVVTERVDPVLYDLCYDYVGETSETVARIWPATPDENAALPSITELVAFLSEAKPSQIENYLVELLDIMTPSERWALIKLGTGGFRIGISARQLKNVLASYGGVDVTEIENLWHGLAPPYTNLLQWLDGKAEKPDISNQVVFRPVMLATPIDEALLPDLSPENWVAEWKYDGIRVQLSSKKNEAKLFSRSGDDISHSFPDLVAAADFDGVIDGELLVWNEGNIGSFNDLQQRLNKKRPSKKLMTISPALIIAYDILQLADKDLTHAPLHERKEQLATLIAKLPKERFLLSSMLPFNDSKDLHRYRTSAADELNTPTEGLMLKLKQASYVPGRPAGKWYKWKKSPETIDAILMYAQRGHGKRSSFYSDFTFGLWQEDNILPVGKAYSGFTDAELSKLDKWVRNNTSAKYGPVREVEKSMVVEIAFDSVHESKRHKSGVALRFPRFKAIRWDKPVDEADKLENLKKLVT